MNINYLHVVPDSQSYDDIDQIITSLKYAMACYKLKNEPKLKNGAYSSWPIVSLEHILRGLENTRDKGLNIKKD